MLDVHPPTPHTSCGREVDGGRYTSLHLRPRLRSADPRSRSGVFQRDFTISAFWSLTTCHMRYRRCQRVGVLCCQQSLSSRATYCRFSGHFLGRSDQWHRVSNSFPTRYHPSGRVGTSITKNHRDDQCDQSERSAGDLRCLWTSAVHVPIFLRSCSRMLLTLNCQITCLGCWGLGIRVMQLFVFPPNVCSNDPVLQFQH